MNESSFDVILAGGGLACGLVAQALRRRHPGLRIALVERSSTLGGNHTWSFHESDLDERGTELLAPFVVQRWSTSEVRFPTHARQLAHGYATVTSARFAKVLATTMAVPGSAVLLDTAVTEVRSNRVTLADGRRLSAPVVFDGRGAAPRAIWEASGFQKFLGWEIELARPITLAHPLLMDATGPQRDGFRFFYVLPFSPRRLLVEETFFSAQPSFDVPRAREAVDAYVKHAGWELARVVREEQGILPMPLQAEGTPPLGSPFRIGALGGWLHPTTAYTLPIAARVAEEIAAGPLETVSTRLLPLWRAHRRQAQFAAFLNRLLFKKARPEHGVAIFERFFTLPDDTVKRFFALQMNAWDRVRLVCGRPPTGMTVRDLLFPKEAEV